MAMKSLVTFIFHWKANFEDIKVVTRSLRRTDNTMTRRKRTKEQTTTYKTKKRETRIPQKPGVNSGVPKG